MGLILLLSFILLGSSVTHAFLDFQDYGDALLQLAGTLHDQCNLIVGINQAEIDDMRNGTFIENERVQRYVLCLFVVPHVIYPADLTLNTKEMNRVMPKKLTKGTKMYLDCLEDAKKSGVKVPHLIIWNMVQCVYKEDPEHFVMF